MEHINNKHICMALITHSGFLSKQGINLHSVKIIRIVSSLNVSHLFVNYNINIKFLVGKILYTIQSTRAIFFFLRFCQISWRRSTDWRRHNIVVSKRLRCSLRTIYGAAPLIKRTIWSLRMDQWKADYWNRRTHIHIHT